MLTVNSKLNTVATRDTSQDGQVIDNSKLGSISRASIESEMVRRNCTWCWVDDSSRPGRKLGPVVRCFEAAR